MKSQNSRFNRILLGVLGVFYLLTLAGFSYANWSSDPAFMEWWKTLLNLVVLSIPLVPLYGAIYVLVVAWRAHKQGEALEPRLAQVVHWGPRGVAIMIALFLGLFSLDVFEMEATALEKLGGFLLHNIPSFLLLALLLVAWRRPQVGFWAFLAAGVAFALFFVRSLDALPSLLLFVLPILLVAGLFYADWKWLGTEPLAAGSA